MRTILVPLLALALAGCGAQPKSTGSSTQDQESNAAGSRAGSGAGAVTAAAPRQIDELTDQTMVYECPKCGMDFDRAGKCSMDGTDLVATQVSYICPADQKPVERAGKCPRCAVNARIEKTAMAGQPAATGN